MKDKTRLLHMLCLWHGTLQRAASMRRRLVSIYLSPHIQFKHAHRLPVSYMNAWAQTIKDHTNSNAPLQTGWSGASWARAAEIIRHTYNGWAAKDIAAFETMLKNVYLPKLLVGSQNNGNWELVMMEAALGISVFLDDKSSYDAAMQTALSRIPAYVYLTSDGPYPKAAPGSGFTTKEQIIKFWQGQSTYPESGIAQETCRDFVHTGYGIASM